MSSVIFNGNAHQIPATQKQTHCATSKTYGWFSSLLLGDVILLLCRILKSPDFPKKNNDSPGVLVLGPVGWDMGCVFFCCGLA